MPELSLFLCLPTSSSRDWTALSCGTSVSMSLGVLASSQLMRASPTCKWCNVEACKLTQRGVLAQVGRKQGVCARRLAGEQIMSDDDY